MRMQYFAWMQLILLGPFILKDCLLLPITGSCDMCQWCTWTTQARRLWNRSMGHSIEPCCAWCPAWSRMLTPSPAPWWSFTSCPRYRQDGWLLICVNHWSVEYWAYLCIRYFNMLLEASCMRVTEAGPICRKTKPTWKISCCSTDCTWICERQLCKSKLVLTKVTNDNSCACIYAKAFT